MNDTKDIHTIEADWLLYSNPVATNGLVQVTMGAPQTIYHGGLLRARVRYFDIDRVRPGLPEDVAALVKVLEADRTVIELVNLSTRHTGKLIVQAGAFGEHSFTNVTYMDHVMTKWPEKVTGSIERNIEKRVIPVNGKYFTVEMPPGTCITLEIGTRRYVNDPSYAFPWHGGKVPQK